MRKDRLYFFTFLSITVIYIIIASIAFQYLVKESSYRLLETHLEFSKKEAKSFSILVGQQMAYGIAKDSITGNIQQSLTGTDLKMGFLSMYDWSGKIIAHPDIKNVGQFASPNNAFVTSVTDDLDAESFYTLLLEDLEKGEQNSGENDLEASKVIALSSVENSDWIVAAHANIDSIAQQMSDFKRQFLIIFLMMGALVVLSSVMVLRLLGSKYEKRLELKNEKLEDEVINLSKLNRAVGDYQQKVIEKETVTETDVNNPKKRILTYIRNELVPIPIEEIAYIYMENTITYVVCIDGKRSTTNLSLDELFSQFDESYFFRANRQFIIAISSIDKIVKYGNNQLKILVKPDSDTAIIISKNRASQFKQWLNM
ncbi:LytTR family transcriptional regulator DNA-binding domain-containing protein [Spongiivirga citrea]|uniref:LytTR family transcriptional regulator n=1 Tax=Spongiivirga citrea TaxID=1481457 RepID=A0A6M0CYQ6_9FLAO|nr:LytTR family transcriptional regulator DNA-binding domain-containing protein [Spongiivirga citrea]NER18880.1 LytTR family transcriptional regulator [Spongiivirga citrea]